MTTTVWCNLNKTVTSDTRWSAKIKLSDGGSYLVYCDDSGFDKIADRNKTTVLFAGSCYLIGLWKDWWQNSFDLEQVPPFDAILDGTRQTIDLLIINKLTNKPVFSQGKKLVVFDTDESAIVAAFSGTGMHYASRAWDISQCPFNAIQFAGEHDLFTSETFKYVELSTGNNNLSPYTHDVEVVNKAIMEKGFIMNISNTNTKAVLLSDHQLGGEVSDLFASGKVFASAPGVDESIVWDDNRKSRLMKALEEVKTLEEL